MAKKASPIDALESLPAGRSKSRTFIDQETPEHRAMLLDVRKRRKAGRITCNMKTLITELRKLGMKIAVSTTTFNHWLNRDE